MRKNLEESYIREFDGYELSEAFKALDEIGLEESAADVEREKKRYDLLNQDDLVELRDYLGEDQSGDADEIEMIVDLEAEEEEDLKNAHVGEIILQCNKCHGLVFKPDFESLEEDSTKEGVFNVGEDCPYCGNTEGFTIAGKSAKLSDFRKSEEDEIDREVEDDLGLDSEPEEKPEEEVNESLPSKNNKAMTIAQFKTYLQGDGSVTSDEIGKVFEEENEVKDILGDFDSYTELYKVLSKDGKERVSKKLRDLENRKLKESKQLVEKPEYANYDDIQPIPELIKRDIKKELQLGEAEAARLPKLLKAMKAVHSKIAKDYYKNDFEHWVYRELREDDFDDADDIYIIDSNNHGKLIYTYDHGDDYLTYLFDEGGFLYIDKDGVHTFDEGWTLSKTPDVATLEEMLSHAKKGEYYREYSRSIRYIYRILDSMLNDEGLAVESLKESFEHEPMKSKYLIAERTKDGDYIQNVYGPYSSIDAAKKSMSEMIKDIDSNIVYLEVEEIDPRGSYADLFDEEPIDEALDPTEDQINATKNAMKDFRKRTGGSDDEISDEEAKDFFNLTKEILGKKEEFNREVKEGIYDKGLSAEKANIFEFPNGDFFYVDEKDGKLFAGNATNNGITREFEIDYDDELDIDANLGLLYDAIVEQRPELMDDSINEDLHNNLPEFCYSTLPTTGEVIIIKNGETGYYRTNYDLTGDEANELVKSANERLGVSERQRRAMEIGSMYGWNVPGANPEHHINKNESCEYLKEDISLAGVIGAKLATSAIGGALLTALGSTLYDKLFNEDIDNKDVLKNAIRRGILGAAAVGGISMIKTNMDTIKDMAEVISTSSSTTGAGSPIVNNYYDVNNTSNAKSYGLINSIVDSSGNIKTEQDATNFFSKFKSLFSKKESIEEAIRGYWVVRKYDKNSGKYLEVVRTANEKEADEALARNPGYEKVYIEAGSKEDDEKNLYQELDVTVENFDNERFDKLVTDYLHEVYQNAESFETTSGSISDNKLIVEGIISFKSGKKTASTFIFESSEITKRGKAKFRGLNETFSNYKRAFSLVGSINEGIITPESLTYKYSVKTLTESKRIYGRSLLPLNESVNASQEESKQIKEAVCQDCDGEMMEVDGCNRSTIGGYKRIRYGESDYDSNRPEGSRCPDCNTTFGKYHHLGCDMERCPKCGRQLISCDCFTNDDFNELDFEIEESVNESVIEEVSNVEDKEIINIKEPGFITKKHELEEKGYKLIGSGDNQLIYAKPEKIEENVEQLKESIQSVTVESNEGNVTILPQGAEEVEVKAEDGKLRIEIENESSDEEDEPFLDNISDEIDQAFAPEDENPQEVIAPINTEELPDAKVELEDEPFISDQEASDEIEDAFKAEEEK